MKQSVIFSIWILTLILVGIWGLNQYFAKKSLEYQLQEKEISTNRLLKNKSGLKAKLENVEGCLFDVFSDWETAELKKAGFTNPVEEIKKDLLERPDLIPADAVLGGKMFFYPDQICIINKNWVIAGFEDGHIMGMGLFEYRLKNGTIEWKVLNYTLL